MTTRQAKISIAGTMVVGLLVLATTVARAEEVPEVVRMSWFNNATPMVLGKADGTLEKKIGTKVRWDQLGSGGAVLTALAAKELDIGMIGGPPTAAGIARGLPIEVIAFEGVIGNSERLIARPDVKSMKDLEGKRVAYTPGSSTHYALNAAFQAYKIDISKVNLVSLGAPDMVAAWKRGDIDAGYVWPPFTFQMEGDRGHELLTTKALQPYGYFVWNNYIVRKEFAQRYPSTVVALLKAYNDYVKAYRADPAGVSRTIANHLGQDQKTIQDTLAGRDFYTLEEQLSGWIGTPETKAGAKMAKGFMDTAQFLRANGDIKSSDVPSTFAPVINPTYAQRAVQ
jgi:taurine transport system substrate-binding protein